MPGHVCKAGNRTSCIIITLAEEHQCLFGRNQLILLADRSTQVQVACPRPLCGGAQPGLEPATDTLPIAPSCHH